MLLIQVQKFGWFAAAFEWLATYLMLWPADGRMKKEDIRAVYNVRDVTADAPRTQTPNRDQSFTNFLAEKCHRE